MLLFLGGEVENGAESQTGDGQVLAGHHRGDRSAQQGGSGHRDGGVLHLLPEGGCNQTAQCCPLPVETRKGLF